MNTVVSLEALPPQQVEVPQAYQALLARVKKALDTASEIIVSSDDIRPYEGQPREYFNPGSIRLLSASIDAGGQTSSGMVREKPADLRYDVVDTGVEIKLVKITGKTRYELIDGERRWRSIRLIQASTRPAYRAKLIIADDDVVQYLISGITNFNREGHTALESMKTIAQHVNFGFPLKEIAKLLGMSEMWARQLYGLKQLEPRVQALLDPALPKPNQLPVIAAIQIAKIEEKFQLGLAERVIRKDITLGMVRGEVLRVAQKEGSYVRVRDVRPDKKWISFKNQIEVGFRTATDIKSKIQQDDLNQYINTRHQEVTELLRKLEDTKELLSATESAIRQARK